MKKYICILTLLPFLCIQSCKNEVHSSKNLTDTIVVKQSSESNKTIDPDLTDTIPAEQYGIYSSNPKTAELVRLALNKHYQDDLKNNYIPNYSKRFIFFEYDLNEDKKKEILVGLTGSYFCGTGGCTQLLLDNNGNLITAFSVAGNPIIIDTNKTNGWKDLIIWSGNKNRVIKFNGTTYPSNPSIQPELKLIPGDELPRALDFENEPYAWFQF